MNKPTWRKPSGAPVSCTEKIKVLNENYDELRTLAQEALDDALLMGCSEQQIRAILRQMIDDLRAFARKRGLNIGLVEPNEEEQAKAEESAQNAEPDPATVLAEAQGQALQAAAAKDMATIEKIGSEVALNEAKVVDMLGRSLTLPNDNRAIDGRQFAQ